MELADLRAPARHVVGLPRARLGWLLGMGPGRERGAHAVARVSREGAFVVQNLLLLGVVAVVMWGTMLPLVSGLFGDVRVVSASYYERAAAPLLAAILALMAAGPLLPWRRAGVPTLRALRWPVEIGRAHV